jgi:hypothetical protein
MKILSSHQFDSHILYVVHLQPSRDEYNKGKNAVPETQGTADGSAKRNITRKHDHDPHRYVQLIQYDWMTLRSNAMLIQFISLYM